MKKLKDEKIQPTGAFIPGFKIFIHNHRYHLYLNIRCQL